MKTLSAADIIAKHADALNHTPWGQEATILAMLQAEPESTWYLVDSDVAPNGAECPVYATKCVGESGPVTLAIYDAVEPGWQTERAAEQSLRDIGVIDDLIAEWA